MVSRLPAENYYVLFFNPLWFPRFTKKALTSVNKLCYNIEVEISFSRGNLAKQEIDNDPTNPLDHYAGKVRTTPKFTLNSDVPLSAFR